MVMRRSSGTFKDRTGSTEEQFASSIKNKLQPKTATTSHSHQSSTGGGCESESDNGQGNAVAGVPSHVEELKFKVGDKVYVHGISQVGIVKFLGTTHFSDGIWVGIELYTGSIGKSDGSVQGHRYFECQPQHGIFVRPAYCTKFISSSPTAEVKVDKSSSLDSAAGGFRAMWVAAESSTANLPPPISTKSVDDLASLCPPSRRPLVLPPPRKVTVEYQQPIATNSSSPINHTIRTTSTGRSDDLATNELIDKIIKSSAFAKTIQHHVDRAMEQSLQSIVKEMSQRYISLESLMLTIGAAVAEVCDKVDVVAEQGGRSSSSSEGKEPSSHPTSPLRRSTSKMSFSEVDAIANSLHGGVMDGLMNEVEGAGEGDPYQEVARLRQALTTVSLLAREAQAEIIDERQEMEEQIRLLRAQLQSQQAT